MIGLMKGAVTFPIAVFEADTVLDLIQHERITHMPGPPTMFSALLDHPRRDEYDLSSLRQAIVGAATIPAVLVRRMRDELGIGSILSAYGLTENHALVSLTAPDDPPDVVATTVGRVLADVDLRVVDDAGHDAPAGEQGELLVRGPFLMTGYYEDADATSRTIVDGWLHTGDVGVLDADGYLRITDRKKDMFIVGGFNVAPAEVEKALCAMAGIAQVAVVGIPDDYFGEVGAAFVIPTPGAHLAPGRRPRLRPRTPRQLQGPAPGDPRRGVPGERNRQGAEERAQRAGSGPPADLTFELLGEAGPAPGAPARLVDDLVDAAAGDRPDVLPEIGVVDAGRFEPVHELATVVPVRERAVAAERHSTVTLARQDGEHHCFGLGGSRRVGRTFRTGAELLAHAAHGLGRNADRAGDGPERRVRPALELLRDAGTRRARVDRPLPSVAADPLRDAAAVPVPSPVGLPRRRPTVFGESPQTEATPRSDRSGCVSRIRRAAARRSSSVSARP